jgi:hypothetical protein
MAFAHGFSKTFEFVANISTATGTTTLVAAPGAGKALRIQSLIICLTTTSVQTFDIEDTSGTVELFKAPASLAIGPWPIDAGPLGHPLTTNEALRYVPSAAGSGLTISGWGWVWEI